MVATGAAAVDTAAMGGPKRGEANANGELGPYSDADSRECILNTVSVSYTFQTLCRNGLLQNKP